MSITEALGLSGTDYSILGKDTASFLSSGSTTTFKAGQPVRYLAKLGNVELEACSTFLGGRLTNLTTLNSSGENKYLLINGSMRHVKMTHSVVIDGVELSIAEVFRSLVNENITDESAKMDMDRFCQVVGRYGFDIDNRNNGMGLNFVHFSADPTKTEAVLDWFRSVGAEDHLDRINNRGNIVSAFGIDDFNAAPEIDMIRVGSIDRDRSINGTGFVNFIDALWGNFDRFIGQTLKAKAMRAMLETKAAKLDAEAIATSNREIAEVQRSATAWMGTWGGVTERTTVDPNNGKRIPTGIFDTTRVPVGSFSSNETEHDFWRNTNTVAASTAPAVDDEVNAPF